MIRILSARFWLPLLAALSLWPAMVSSCQAQDVQAELMALGRSGGGIYRLAPRAQVTVREGIVVPRGVTLDLNGGELVAVLTGPGAAGVRLLSDSGLRNGTVSVVSRGSPGTQPGAHAAVLIGALLGENTSVDRISAFESPSGWVVSGITVRSDKRVALGDGVVGGAAGIQVMGGAYDGLIEHVTVPDSPVLWGGVMLDWGVVGPIQSSDVPASAAAFRGGAAYTTHPHDIVIRDIRIGRLTRQSISETGSFGIRLSGVHDVTVSGVTVASVSEAGLFHTAGDLGYEFARPADRARAHLGIKIDNLNVTEGGYMVRSNTYADNVGRAAAKGYRPRLDPIAFTDMTVSNVTGSAGRSVGDGLRLDHQRGGHFSNIEARGFRKGFFIDEQVYDVTIENPVAIDSREVAIAIEHPSRPPANVRLISPRAVGRTGAAARIRVGRSDGVRVSGANGDLVVDQSARGAQVSD